MLITYLGSQKGLLRLERDEGNGTFYETLTHNQARQLIAGDCVWLAGDMHSITIGVLPSPDVAALPPAPIQSPPWCADFTHITPTIVDIEYSFRPGDVTFDYSSGSFIRVTEVSGAGDAAQAEDAAPGEGGEDAAVTGDGAVAPNGFFQEGDLLIALNGSVIPGASFPLSTFRAVLAASSEAINCTVARNYHEQSQANLLAKQVVVQPSQVRSDLVALDREKFVSDPEKFALMDLFFSTNGTASWKHTSWVAKRNDMDSWDGVKLAVSTTSLRNAPKSVVELNLSGTGLSGPIPASIKHLKRLERLDLSENKLTGSIPPGLLSLHNTLNGCLRSWCFHGNQLSLPQHIGMLISLCRLDLKGQDIVGTLPAAVGDLRSLQILNLSGNFLTGSIPSLFRLKRLAILMLHDNQLDGDATTEFSPALSSLGALRVLRLDGNTGIGGELDLTSLSLLEVAKLPPGVNTRFHDNYSGGVSGPALEHRVRDLRGRVIVWYPQKDLQTEPRALGSRASLPGKQRSLSPSRSRLQTSREVSTTLQASSFFRSGSLFSALTPQTESKPYDILSEGEAAEVSQNELQAEIEEIVRTENVASMSLDSHSFMRLLLSQGENGAHQNGIIRAALEHGACAEEVLSAIPAIGEDAMSCGKAASDDGLESKASASSGNGDQGSGASSTSAPNEAKKQDSLNSTDLESDADGPDLDLTGVPCGRLVCGEWISSGSRRSLSERESARVFAHAPGLFSALREIWHIPPATWVTSFKHHGLANMSSDGGRSGSYFFQTRDRYVLS